MIFWLHGTIFHWRRVQVNNVLKDERVYLDDDIFILNLQLISFMDETCKILDMDTIDK